MEGQRVLRDLVLINRPVMNHQLRVRAKRNLLELEIKVVLDLRGKVLKVKVLNRIAAVLIKLGILTKLVRNVIRVRQVML